MKTVLLISAAFFLTGCSTLKTGTKVVKATGQVAAGSGKIIYKAGEATGKAVVGVGKGTANAVDKATSAEVVQDVTRSPTAETVERVGDKNSFGEVMLTPLSDINLRKQRIPKKLSKLKSPYEPLPVTNCATLLAEIVSYDDILGPDLDSERFESKEERDKRKTRETTLDVAEAGVGSFIPFRGLVRAATGATKHENNIRSAYRTGIARRGYLRGLYDARSCGTQRL